MSLIDKSIIYAQIFVSPTNNEIKKTEHLMTIGIIQRKLQAKKL